MDGTSIGIIVVLLLVLITGGIFAFMTSASDKAAIKAATDQAARAQQEANDTQAKLDETTAAQAKAEADLATSQAALTELKTSNTATVAALAAAQAQLQSAQKNANDAQAATASAIETQKQAQAEAAASAAALAAAKAIPFSCSFQYEGDGGVYSVPASLRNTGGGQGDQQQKWAAAQNAETCKNLNVGNGMCPGNKCFQWQNNVTPAPPSAVVASRAGEASFTCVIL